MANRPRTIIRLGAGSMTLTHTGAEGSIDVDLTGADPRQVAQAARTVAQAHGVETHRRLDPERIPLGLLARAVEDAMWRGVMGR